MRTVTVVGTGEAREVPDTVVVRVAATHQASGVAEALAGAGSAADEIVRIGREHTDASRIASTDLNVWPATDNEGRPAGYQARHALSLACPDVTQAGALLSALASAVGDRLQVEGIGMQVGDPGRALDQARAAAYADAVAKASRLAGLAGARLGAVQSVSEGAGWGPAPVAGGRAFAAKDLAIQPGETTLSATLTVTFELAP